DQKSMSISSQNSKKKIKEGNDVLEEIYAKRAESINDRYFHVAMRILHSDPERESEYEALTEGERDAYWERRVAELGSEEEADPAAFAVRYGLEPFWRKHNEPERDIGSDAASTDITK